MFTQQGKTHSFSQNVVLTLSPDYFLHCMFYPSYLRAKEMRKQAMIFTNNKPDLDEENARDDRYDALRFITRSL